MSFTGIICNNNTSEHNSPLRIEACQLTADLAHRGEQPSSQFRGDVWSPPANTGFIGWNYCYRSVATQIFPNAELATIPYFFTFPCYLSTLVYFLEVFNSISLSLATSPIHFLAFPIFIPSTAWKFLPTRDWTNTTSCNTRSKQYTLNCVTLGQK